MGEKIIFLTVMCIKLDHTNMLAKVVHIGLIHQHIFDIVELKTKCSNRYHIQTFDILYFYYYRDVLFKMFSFVCEKEIIWRQSWRWYTLTYLFGDFSLHNLSACLTCALNYLIWAFHCQYYILKWTKFVLKYLNA
jgi:hypothetical protein